MPRITITVPDHDPQPYRFSLDRQIVHFGRADDNDIVIDCGSISSEHAVMERVTGGYVLTDLGSTNGIKHNGTEVKKVQLRNGQNIELGDVDFEFMLSEEELSALKLEDPASQLPPLDDDEMETPSHVSAVKEDKPMPEQLRKSEPSHPPRSIHALPHMTAPKPPSGVINFLIGLAAALAFTIGVAMHFEKATGESLMDTLQKRINGNESK